MSKVRNLQELTTPELTDLLYAVDFSEGTNGGRKVTLQKIKDTTALTASEIKTLYESNADTNAFTDAEKTKLAGVEAGATADQLASEVPYTNTGTNLSSSDVQAALTELDLRTLPLYVKVVSGLTVSYAAGVVRYQNTVYQVSAGVISLTASITNGTLYVDIDGIVKQTGSGVNPPARSVPIALFTTGVSSVSSLTDIRSIVNATDRGTGTPVATGTANSAGSAVTLALSDHVHDTTIARSTATDTVDATTTSVTDVLLTSMTITPSAGTYLLNFGTSTLNSANGAERNYFSVYVGGVQVTASERKVGTAGGAYVPISLQAVVTPNGSQAVEIRWRVIAGTGTASHRSMTLTRLGS